MQDNGVILIEYMALQLLSFHFHKKNQAPATTACFNIRALNEPLRYNFDIKLDTRLADLSSDRVSIFSIPSKA